MRKFASWISGLLLVIVFIAGVVFSYFNTTPVSLAFIDWQTQPRPLAVWVVAAFVTGGGAGLLLGFGVLRQFRYRAEVKRLRRELQQAKKDLRSVRARSLRAPD